VTVTATGAGNSPQTFPVTLVVSSVPILSTTQTSMNFNFQIGQTAPQSQVLTLSSTGAPLNYTVAATSTNCNNFLSATPTSGQTQVPPGQPGQVVVSVNTTGITTPTVCTGTLTLTVPGSTNTPLTIPVTLNASTTPLINVSQGAIAATAVAGTTSTVQQNIALTSTDLTTALNFAAAAVTSPPGLTWLTVTPNTGSTPNVLNVTLNPAGLPVGIYMGSIVVSSTSPNVPTQTIPVTFTIASGIITAVPTTLSFTQPVGGTAPASQTIQLSGIPTGGTVGATATTFNGSGWLTVTASASGTLTVTANGSSLAQGNYQGLVTVFVPGATPSPLYIPVSLVVGNPQTLTFTPTSVTFNATPGSTTPPASQNIQLASTGGNVPYTATFAATSGGNFLTVTPASGNTPQQLTITPNQTVIRNLAPGTYTGTITVGSTSIPGGSQAIPVTLIVGTQTGTGPTVSSVVNSASSVSGAVAPGEIITIFGTNLGSSPPVFLTLTSNGLVSTTLGNTSVTFDGISAPLIYASPTQVNAIVPYEVAGKTTTTMVVTNNGVKSTSQQLQVASASPAIFTISQTGSGQGAILNQNGSVNGTANPAAKGSVIAIYATGGGQIRPVGVTGTVTPTTGTFPSLVGSVSVTIGGAPAQITYSGSAPGLVSGAIQINAVVPTGVATGNQPVVVTVGTNTGPTNVTVAVQ